MWGQIPGNSVITTSGVLGNSGKPKRVFFVSIVPEAATAGVLALYNGTGTGDDKFVGDLVAPAGTGALFDLGDKGIRFDKGCYVSCGATSGVSYAVIVYQEEQ